MKMKSLLLSGLLSISACVLFAESTVKINGERGTMFVLGVKDASSIAVSLDEPATVCWFNFTQDGSTSRVYLSGSGTAWTGTVPVNHAGAASWTVEYERADGTTGMATDRGSIQFTETLDQLNHPNMALWFNRLEGSYNNLKNGGADAASGYTWYAFKAYMPSAKNIRLPGHISTAATSQHSYIRTQKTLGAGYVSFKARAKQATVYSETFTTNISSQIVYNPCDSFGETNNISVLDAQYVRMDVPGIGNIFSMGTTIRISGSSIAALNGDLLVSNSGADFLIFEVPSIQGTVQAGGLKLSILSSSAVTSTLVVEGTTLPLNSAQNIKTSTRVEVPYLSDGWTHFRIPVSVQNQKLYFWFRNDTVAPSSDNLTLDTYAIELADINIIPPIPDVKIYKTEIDYDPGFPSLQDPVSFTICVSNTISEAEAANITPKLMWRQGDATTFNETVLTNVAGRTLGGEGTYACVLSPNDPNVPLTSGTFEYFYRVDFTGYTPVYDWSRYYNGSGAAAAYETIANEDDYKIWIRRSQTEPLEDNVSESRSPAYYPDFETLAHPPTYVHVDQDSSNVYLEVVDPDMGWGFDVSHLYDIGALYKGVYPMAVNDTSLQSDRSRIEGVYPYLTLEAADGVRRFRSKYGSIGLVVDNHPLAAKPSRMDPSYEMQMVGDYTWQAILHVTNAIDVAMSVTGACYYAEAGQQSFEDRLAPYVWGQINQEETAINPPMSGDLAAVQPALEPAPAGWAPVRTQIDYDGFLMFRYCSTNGQYQIRRAAWQDFNTWQADDNLYSRSYGVFGMKTFLANVATAPKTRFADQPFSDPDVDNPGVPANTGIMYPLNFFNGLLAQNVWVISEREGSDADHHDRPNWAFRLSTTTNQLGTLQTTSQTRGEGRGTLKLRVRASSEDDRIAYYNDPSALSWQNKQYVVAFRASELSPGRPYASVMGYYQDHRNYWEARVTQESELGATEKQDRQRLRLEVYRVQDGVRTLMKDATATFGTGANENSKGSLASGENQQGFILSLQLATEGSSVKYCAYLYQAASAKNSAGTIQQPKTIICRVSSGNRGDTDANRWISASSSVKSGTIGVNASDAVMALQPYVFGADVELLLNRNTCTDVEKLVSSGSLTLWDHNAREIYNYADPWEGTSVLDLTSNTTQMRTTLTRKRPVAAFRVKVYRSGEEHSDAFMAPVPTYTEDWDTEWDSFHADTAVFPKGRQDKVFNAESFVWKEYEIPMCFWDDSYISIQALTHDANGNPCTGHLMVDDLECKDWRPYDAANDPTSLAFVEDQEQMGAQWTTRYAVVADDDRSINVKEIQLDRTKTNPLEEQYVCSPLLEKGVGDILFTCHAELYPVCYKVQLVEAGSGEIQDLLCATQAVSSVDSSVYAPALQNISGYLRILTQPYRDAAGVERFGTLCISGDSENNKNPRATDYPNDGDSSWEAYNMLVSTFRTDKKLKFDGSDSLHDAYRSAVLNDAYAKSTLQDSVYDEHQPYLQTPAIDTGVGEISFWYRASPDNAGKPAKLLLMVAVAAGTPDEQWRPLTVDDLYDPTSQPGHENDDRSDYLAQVAQLESLANITTSTWTYFNAEFFQKDFRMLRIYSVANDEQTRSNNRVLVDNVLVTEPVRSSIDVGTIEFFHAVDGRKDIPLSTSSTGCKIKLVNPRMKPEEISVRLDYYVGTNKWGYSEWGSNPTGSLTFTNALAEIVISEIVTNRVEDPDSEKGYREVVTTNQTIVAGDIDRYSFSSENTIPKLPVDSVVQYAAIVKYTGRFAEDICSETQGKTQNGFWFDNPWWYEPVDLNVNFGTTNQPVAHYWVFSCTTNVVKINEVLPMWSSTSNFKYQFVELMGPEGVDIENWKLDVVYRPSSYLAHYGEADMWMTNIVLKSTRGTGKTVFNAANNAVTNKGWGFYMLGNEYWTTDRDQALFPPDQDSKGLYMYLPGGLCLRRSMGAYADRICWGRAGGYTLEAQRLTEYIDQGYEYVGNRATSSSAGFGLQGDSTSETGGIIWGSAASPYTFAGYNAAEEENLPWLTEHEEPDDPEPDPPLISQPVITAFSIADGKASISFTFSVTNGVPLTEKDFTWRLEWSSNLGFRPSDRMTLSGITVDEAHLGEVKQVDLTDIDLEGADVRFFRIRAVPVE